MGNLDPDSKDAITMHKQFKTLGKKKAEADTAYKSRQFTESVALYTEAIALSPGGNPESTTGKGGGMHRAKLFFNRASASANLQQHANVISDCTRALRLDSNYVKAHTRRAASSISLADEASNGEDQSGAERCCHEVIQDYEKAGELTSPTGPMQNEVTHKDMKKKVLVAKIQMKRAGEKDL